MALDLTFARRQVEALMTDECEVVRPGERVLDETNGHLVPADPAPLYSGRCLVRTDGETAKVRLPASAAEVKPGDQVRVTSSARDPYLVGALIAVTDVSRSTFNILHRLEGRRVR